MANTMKLNGVRPEVIRLQLFPFSLRDIVATWFDLLPYDSVNTWEELVEAYLGRFSLYPSHLKEEGRSACSNKEKMKTYTLVGRGSRGF